MILSSEYSDKANSNPCSFTFAGFEPFSEPEARAQAHYILNERDPWKVFLTLHSYGQLWMAPWGYTTDPPPDYDKMVSTLGRLDYSPSTSARF